MHNTNLGTMVGYYNIQGAQEIEQQGLQTLYLMNPAGYPGYEDTPATSPNILLLNSAASSVPPSLNPLLTHSSAAPATSNSIHQLLGIPLLPAASTSDPNHYISSLQAFNSNLNPRLWSSAMPPHQLGLRQQQQGLSLSLSPHRHRVPMASASETGLSNGVSDMQRFWMGSKYLKVAQQLLDEVVSAGNESKGESTKGSETKCRLGSAKAAELGKNEKASDFTTAERQDLHMKNVKLVNMLEEVEQRYKLYHHHIQTIVFSFEAAMGSGAARTYTALALQTISKHFRWLKDVISAQIRGNAKSLQGEEGSLGDEDKSSSGSRLRLIDQQLRQKRAFQQIGMVQHNAWRPQRGLPERSVSILRAWLFEHFLHPYPKDSDKQLLAKQTGLTRSQVSNWFINARVRLWKPMVEEMYMEELKGPGDINIRIGDENSSSSSKSNNTNNNNIGEYSTSKSSNALFDHHDHQEIFVSPTKIEQTPALTPPPQDYSAILPTSWDQEEEECRQSNPAKRVLRSGESMHSMNTDFGVMEDRDLMIKFGMGLQNDEEDRSRHGYSLMSRKISSGDIAAGFSVANYPAGQLVESCRCLISVEPTTPRLMMNKSVALTLGLPPHADHNNNNNNLRLSSHAGGEHGQSFLSSTAHDRIQQQLVGRSRVELSSRGSNSEYLGGGVLNKEQPSSYSSSNSLYI